MKVKLLLFLILLSYGINAQLTITPGTQFAVTGNTQITLNNTNLVNNGSLTAGNSIISFTGNASSMISGNQPVQFFALELNKSNNAVVTLNRSIAVSQRIRFTSGFLDLNGFDTDLGTTGQLEDEKENSRITGINGGQVLLTAALNAPLAANPGNLGVVISTPNNLGNVIIRRGHQPRQNVFGNGSSIRRYYEISPVNNTNMGATLRFHYFDGELNSLTENTLVIYKKSASPNWLLQGFSVRDITNNFVERNAVDATGSWTLSSVNNALPVHFTLFNLRCDNNRVIINWKTAQEQNSSRFDVQRTIEGTDWTVIGSMPAAGNSTNERSYSFVDNNPVANSQYRIAEYDIDGRTQFTNTQQADCDVTDVFKVWPNPFRDALFVSISASNGSTAIIKLFDSKGALVKMQSATILPGVSQLKIDAGSLAKGVYSLYVEWNNGMMKKTIQVVKQ
jgi:hypothetical protein